MNIFVLDNDIVKSARFHCDKHVVKQCLETAQMLSTAVQVASEKCYDDLYKPCFINHPCNVWARENRSNFLWLYVLGLELSVEYYYRYGKVHKSQAVMIRAADYCNDVSFPVKMRSPFAQAMPDEYKHPNAVTAYRRYYIGEKKHLATWTKRPVPEWFREA